jgi:GAF domain-containing protein
MHIPARTAVTMHDPWIGVDLAADRVAWARLLRRAHEVALSGRGTPPVLRDVIVRSWARCAAAGVDPDRPARLLLDRDETARRFAAHPLAAALDAVRRAAAATAGDARHLLVLSDAGGVLLWADGHPSMLEAAALPRFRPGAVWSEAAAGTNAVGTALVLDHAIQVFSAEHFSRLLHGWTDAAAPVHDPASGAVVGAVGLAASFRTAHPHTLALAGALAGAAEAVLAGERERRDAELAARYVDRLSAAGRRPSALVSTDGRVLLASPRGWLDGRVDLPEDPGPVVLADGTRAIVEPLGDGARVVWGVRGRERRAPRRVLRIRALGDEPPTVRLDGRPLALAARQVEVLVVLALEGGLRADELARAIHGSDAKTVTARAEVARLRRVAPDLVRAQPYRIAADVRADFLDAERLLDRGESRAAARLYRGPLLPASTAPGIVAARARIEAAMQRRATPGRAAGRPPRPWNAGAVARGRPRHPQRREEAPRGWPSTSP